MKVNGFGVIETMVDAMLQNGVPEHIRSDNGPEMTAKVIREWLGSVGSKTLFIEPLSLWEHGFCESFDGKPRDELLNGEIFYSLKEARIVIEQWRIYCNQKRPHSALSYGPPAPVAYSPHHLLDQATIMQHLSAHLVQNFRQVKESLNHTSTRLGIRLMEPEPKRTHLLPFHQPAHGKTEH